MDYSDDALPYNITFKMFALTAQLQLIIGEINILKIGLWMATEIMLFLYLFYVLFQG